MKTIKALWRFITDPTREQGAHVVDYWPRDVGETWQAR